MLLSMNGTILVTGGCGFVGSHVVDELVARGAAVRVLDALLPATHDGRPEYLNPEAEYDEGDLTTPEIVERSLDGVGGVCHQAAMVGQGAFADVVSYVHHNDVGTAVLLRALAARGFAGRLVLAGSMVVYGEGRYRCETHGAVRPRPRSKESLQAGRFDPPCPECGAALTPEAVPEESPFDPRNVYAATKVHQEHLCATFGREHGVPVTALRYHNVYGPRMPRDTPYSGVASIFRSAIERGEAPQVFEDGRQLRDFVHVRDVAHANVLALTSDEPVAGAFNIASGEPRTVAELANTLTEALGADLEAEVTGHYRLGDVRHVFASPTRAEEVLGFRSEVSFADGIRQLASVPMR
jgi:dTDP-L-rhamnose 4-epimerase